MRDLSFCCAAWLVGIAAPALAQAGATSDPASAPPPITFTRAEIAGMSNEQLAARALAAIAADARSARGEASSDPLTRPPPWVSRIYVELSPRIEPALCRHQSLRLSLQPVHFEPARLADPSYDPPAAISDVELQTRYADPGPDASNCPNRNGTDYFSAPDAYAAVTAIRAFRLFRRAVATGTLGTVSCRNEHSGLSCRTARAGLPDVVRFYEVLWMDDQMVVLAIGRATQLRLTLDYRGSDASWRLIRTELVLRPPPLPV